MIRKRVVRETKETRVEIVVVRASASETALPIEVSTKLVQGDRTALPFFDHMVATLARYAGLGLTLRATGDLRHHLMEDVGIALGRAVREITPATAARYGERTIPMDDALVQAVIDVGGRFHFAGELPGPLYAHVLRSFADSLGATLHLRVLAGRDFHHIIEAAYKATGLSLREAMLEGGTVFSTKGSVKWEVEP
jgi:imidazoleglycerol-phosphate dehydratase